MKFQSKQFALLRSKVILLLLLITASCFYIYLSSSFKSFKSVEVRSLVEQWKQRDWRNVEHPQLKFWIYSAYSFDEQQVVIIGSTFPFENDTLAVVHCLFYGSDATERNVEKVKGTIERMAGWIPDTASTFIRCEPRSNLQVSNSRPGFVSVLLGNQFDSEVRIPIVYRTYKPQPPFKFSVCVLPLYGYNEVFHFLEWFEFYKLMGVEHFTFYNTSIGPATSCIMNHYRNSFDGVRVTVKPWHGYPRTKDIDIRDGVGLSGGTNECWYSYKGLSKYMIFVDVDEFIVPKEGIPDYHSLINYLKNSSTRDDKIGAFVFRNAFYGKRRAGDLLLDSRCLKTNPETFHECKNLWIMQFVEREPLTMWEKRTKYIGKPEAVKNGGNHFVHEFEAGWKEMRVDESIAFSRHYRNFGSVQYPSTMVVDRIPLELGTSLAKSVSEKVKFFMKVCG